MGGWEGEERQLISGVTAAAPLLVPSTIHPSLPPPIPSIPAPSPAADTAPRLEQHLLSLGRRLFIEVRWLNSLACPPAPSPGNNLLQTLDLGQNGIGDRGARALAEALKLNTTITKLDLSGNAIDIEGASE